MMSKMKFKRKGAKIKYFITLQNLDLQQQKEKDGKHTQMRPKNSQLQNEKRS